VVQVVAVRVVVISAAAAVRVPSFIYQGFIYLPVLTL